MTSLTLYGDVRHCRIMGRIIAGFILGYYRTSLVSVLFIFSYVLQCPSKDSCSQYEVQYLDSSLGRAEAAKQESNANWLTARSVKQSAFK